LGHVLSEFIEFGAHNFVLLIGFLEGLGTGLIEHQSLLVSRQSIRMTEPPSFKEVTGPGLCEFIELVVHTFHFISVWFVRCSSGRRVDEMICVAALSAAWL